MRITSFIQKVDSGLVGASGVACKTVFMTLGECEVSKSVKFIIT